MGTWEHGRTFGKARGEKVNELEKAYEQVVVLKSQICRLEKMLAILSRENESIGRKVQSKRVEKEMLLSEVAEILGITYDETYELENNSEYSPDVILKEKIARWLAI